MTDTATSPVYEFKTVIFYVSQISHVDERSTGHEMMNDLSREGWERDATNTAVTRTGVMMIHTFRRAIKE